MSPEIIDAIIKEVTENEITGGSPSFKTAKKKFYEKLNSPYYYYRHLSAFEKFFSEAVDMWRLCWKSSEDIHLNRFYCKLYKNYLLSTVKQGKICCSELIYNHVNSIPNTPSYIYLIIFCFIMAVCKRKSDDNLFAVSKI